MKNKVDIFTADYGHREPIKKDDHADEPDASGRKLPQITDPIRGAERINVPGYLKMFLLFTSDMKIMFSDHPEKATTSNFLRLLSYLTRAFLLLIFIRGVLLAFNDHDATAYYLGHKSENDAWKHITMITIVWSLYTFLIYNWCFISHRDLHRRLSWLEPFQVICGMKPAIEFGLTREMLDKLLKRSRYVFYTSLFFAFARSFFGLFIFFFLYNYNFNYIDEEEMIGTIWIFILTFWIFFNSGAAYIISACYDILCYYFKIRFKKVNADIARLIDPNRPLEAKERHGLLFNILHEHNHLCQKVDEYNIFWSRYVLYTYFAVPFVSLYTLYQVIFVNHTSEAIIVMSMMAFEAFVIFTKSSVSGSKMTFVAHKPYFELIRATFGEYPIDLRLQLRILIQRLSGPTISFYCSDLFEVSHKSYFHMVLGFGQNFFLLTDFITVQYMPWQNATTTPLLEYTTPMIEDFSNLIE